MPNLKCKICGTEFPPIKERHYISRDLTKTGLAAAFGSYDEPATFDSYDCPFCGSQVIAQPHKRQFDPKSEEATEEDLLAAMSNENLPDIIEAFGGDCRKIFANEYLDNRAVLPDTVGKEW